MPFQLLLFLPFLLSSAYIGRLSSRNRPDRITLTHNPPCRHALSRGYILGHIAYRQRQSLGRMHVLIPIIRGIASWVAQQATDDGARTLGVSSAYSTVPKLTRCWHTIRFSEVAASGTAKIGGFWQLLRMSDVRRTSVRCVHMAVSEVVASSLASCWRLYVAPSYTCTAAFHFLISNCPRLPSFTRRRQAPPPS